MPTIFYDTFDRANGAVGNGWVEDPAFATGMTILGNAIRVNSIGATLPALVKQSVTAGNVRYETKVWFNPAGYSQSYVELKYHQPVPGGGSSVHALRLSRNGGVVQWWTGASPTSIHTVPVVPTSLATAVKLAIEVDGTTQAAYVDDVLVASSPQFTTGATIPGYFGFEVGPQNNSPAASAFADYFLVGDPPPIGSLSGS